MHSQFCAVQLHDQPKMYETNEGFAFYVTSLLEQLYLLDICCILFRYLLKVSRSRNNNPSFVDAYLNYPKVKAFISKEYTLYTSSYSYLFICFLWLFFYYSAL
jgi:hypothetical protein